MENEIKIKYNPLIKYYKSIKGAIPLGKKCTFRIEIHDSIQESGVNFTLKKIDSDRTNILPLLFEGKNTNYNIYCVDIIPDDTGLFNYGFILLGVTYENKIGIDSSHNAKLYYDNAPLWQLNVYSRKYENPSWYNGKIMYQIFVDRFYNIGGNHAKDGAIYRQDWGNLPEYRPDKQTGEILNNDFFGGNLKGIIEKLPYLKELNVDIIYLNPIFSAFSNHKYDTCNYEEIDEMFGDEDIFTELTTKAEALGIRIILDGVFNHTGSDSIYFDKLNKYHRNGAYQTQNSPYYGWYYFNRWNYDYECWWGISTLPKLNGKNESLKKYLCGEDGIIRKWLRAGASGWRLDVVDELDEGMLNEIVLAAKTEKSDSLIIGEVWENASNKYAYGKLRKYFDGYELDSVMNYPLKNAIIDFIRNGNAKHLSDVNFMILNDYPKHILNNLMNILGTHDTPRILTELYGNPMRNRSREEQKKSRMTPEQLTHGKKLLKLAIILQFTHYGFPCIYYGDEAGMQGCGDPFNRGCFPWENMDRELHHFYITIGKIRKENIVFINGDFEEIEAKEGWYYFKRYNENQEIKIAVNASDSEKHLEINGIVIDLLTNFQYRDNITISAYTAMILKGN